MKYQIEWTLSYDNVFIIRYVFKTCHSSSETIHNDERMIHDIASVTDAASLLGLWDVAMDLDAEATHKMHVEPGPFFGGFFVCQRPPLSSPNKCFAPSPPSSSRCVHGLQLTVPQKIVVLIYMSNVLFGQVLVPCHCLCMLTCIWGHMFNLALQNLIWSTWWNEYHAKHVFFLKASYAAAR